MEQYRGGEVLPRLVGLVLLVKGIGEVLVLVALRMVEEAEAVLLLLAVI